MTLSPQPLPPIPEETARVARSLHPKGNQYMWLRDELGAIYHDEQFTTIYSTVGQFAEQPWRVALMSVIQYTEFANPSLTGPSLSLYSSKVFTRFFGEV